MRAKKMADALKAARMDRNERDRQVYRAPNGSHILCESRGERDFWEGFCGAIQSRELRPDEFSIRDLFEEFIPDGGSILRAWQRGEEVSLQEAAGAVSATTFSNITGQIIYNELLNSYEAEELVFTKMIPVVQTQFDGEKIAGVGGIGDQAEIVTEGKQYPLVGLNEDWIRTPSTVKRGMIVPVTKEAIFFDRTGLVLERAREVGEMLAINKEIRAIDCVIDENTTAHRYNWRDTSYATYQTSTPWINSKTSNALENWSNIDAVEQLFAQMTDPNTGLPVIINADTLIVNFELRNMAEQILGATLLGRMTDGYATTGNLNNRLAPNTIGNIPGLSPKYRIVSSRFMKARTATDTNWFLGQPTKAFRYMQNFPLQVVQAPPNSPEEFQRDIVAQFKASERGAFVVRDPRFMAKSAA